MGRTAAWRPLDARASLAPPERLRRAPRHTRQTPPTTSWHQSSKPLPRSLLGNPNGSGGGSRGGRLGLFGVGRGLLGLLGVGLRLVAAAADGHRLLLRRALDRREDGDLEELLRRARLVALAGGIIALDDHRRAGSHVAAQHLVGERV